MVIGMMNDIELIGQVRLSNTRHASDPYDRCLLIGTDMAECFFNFTNFVFSSHHVTCFGKFGSEPVYREL